MWQSARYSADFCFKFMKGGTYEVVGVDSRGKGDDCHHL